MKNLQKIPVLFCDLFLFYIYDYFLTYLISFHYSYMIGNINNNAATASCTYQLQRKMETWISYFYFIFFNEHTQQAIRPVQNEKLH